MKYTITYAPEAKEGLAKLKRSEPASQMKRSTFPVRSPLTREKRQQKQESRQPNQRDKSTKSV